MANDDGNKEWKQNIDINEQLTKTIKKISTRAHSPFILHI